MPWPRFLYQLPEAAFTSTFGLLPEPQLHPVGAAVVAARGEGRLGRRDLLEGIDGIVVAFDMGGIGLRADDDEVVVHQRLALHAIALGDEFLLAGPVMDEQHVGIALLADLEGLAGPDRDDAHLDAGLLGEDRQQIFEQPAVLGRGRGRDGDEAILGAGARRSGDRP